MDLNKIKEYAKGYEKDMTASVRCCDKCINVVFQDIP